MNDIDTFLASKKFAVAGASENREKYGNKVLRAYVQASRAVVPVNPGAEEVEGIPACSSIADLPEDVDALSIVTPPKVTVEVVKQALSRGIKQIWMQPGAEHPDAVASAVAAGANVIADGACVLVALGYRE
ncbi:MAG: CoA-binding protein [Deltaproteobacteria bacterium]|nr:CoA-binding protein [Deltaproteobacteria bacterium]MBN2674464.1 CoA-binding protein [Deltaproteobacteria bacterium]